MRNKKFGIFLFVFFFLFAVRASAAVTPTLSLSAASGASAELSVQADPHSNVVLRYGPNASITGNLGTTDQNGNLSFLISVSGYSVACGNTAYITVNGIRSQTIDWTLNSSACASNSSTLSFSESTLMLNVGQTQIITIKNGTGSYSVSSNTNSAAVTAALSGERVYISAYTPGSATIKICQASDGQCANVNVVVTNNVVTQPYNDNLPPAISSFSIASANKNGVFMGVDDTLTFTISFNKRLDSNPLMFVAGYPVSLSGVASGPYVGTYKVTGRESIPAAIALRFTDAFGKVGQAGFALLGNLNSGASAPAPAPAPQPVQTVSQAPVPVVTPAPAPVVNRFVFTSFLGVGSVGNEVTELQKRLTEIGMYAGPITGRFGALTEAAVKKFQKARGINQAGYVGPSTRAALNER